MIQSQKFVNIKTGEIAIQIPIMEIADWDEYNGPLEVGEFIKLNSK